MKVYLAHSSHEMEQGYRIEKTLTEMGYEVWNPFDKEKNLFIRGLGWERDDQGGWESEELNWKEEWLKLSDEKKKEISDWITDDDHKGIDWADIVVMLYPEDGRTVGIACEMEYSAKSAMTPLYVYAPTWLFNHPWIVSYAKFRTDSVSKLLNTVRELIE